VVVVVVVVCVEAVIERKVCQLLNCDGLECVVQRWFDDQQGGWEVVGAVDCLFVF
jgi:hypothetical protein